MGHEDPQEMAAELLAALHDAIGQWLKRRVICCHFCGCNLKEAKQFATGDPTLGYGATYICDSCVRDAMKQLKDNPTF